MGLTLLNLDLFSCQSCIQDVAKISILTYLGELLSRPTQLTSDTLSPLVPVFIFLAIHGGKAVGTEHKN